jgi:transcriptional regulator with XRE-family HTH domain
LGSAGPKLRELRVRSEWTAEEIALRTGMSLDLLTAFEEGDSTAAGELTTFVLERLAAACCGTLADLLGNEHPRVEAARNRESRLFGRSCAVDPHG